MKKQILSEEFKRMQKLAGLINENDALDLKSQMKEFDPSSAPKVNPFISWHYRIDPENQKLFLEKIKNLIISNDEVANAVSTSWGSLIRKGVQSWDLNNWKNISDYIMNKFPNLKNQLYQGENNKWPIEDLFKRNK